MPWRWLFPAVVGPPGPRGGVRGVEHGGVLQDGAARAGASVSGRGRRPPGRCGCTII